MRGPPASATATRQLQQCPTVGLDALTNTNKGTLLNIATLIP